MYACMYITRIKFLFDMVFKNICNFHMNMFFFFRENIMYMYKEKIIM